MLNAFISDVSILELLREKQDMLYYDIKNGIVNKAGNVEFVYDAS